MDFLDPLYHQIMKASQSLDLELKTIIPSGKAIFGHWRNENGIEMVFISCVLADRDQSLDGTIDVSYGDLIEIASGIYWTDGDVVKQFDSVCISKDVPTIPLVLVIRLIDQLSDAMLEVIKRLEF